MSQAEPTSPDQNASAIDLMLLLGRCLGNFKMVERVLGAFRTAGEADLRLLQAAVDQSDFKDVTEIAHRLKGSASNVSATRLQELLARAEQLGRIEDATELQGILEQLWLEWASFERCVQVLSPQSSAPSLVSTRTAQNSQETSYARSGC